MSDKGIVEKSNLIDKLMPGMPVFFKFECIIIIVQ